MPNATKISIKPDVVGQRIELIRTNNPYTDLKPGDRGTVVNVTELPYEDTPFKVWVHWDSGSTLGILEGHDDYRMVYDDDDGFNKERKKILLVDDEPDITMAFKLILENAGFIVDTYQDPLVALSKFKPNFYGLVILDIKMPRMNGFELHKEMRKIDPQVMVCFITAGEMYYDEVRNREGEERGEENQYCTLDRERFLQKPTSNVDLVKRIEKMVNMSDYERVKLTQSQKTKSFLSAFIN